MSWTDGYYNFEFDDHICWAFSNSPQIRLPSALTLQLNNQRLIGFLLISYSPGKSYSVLCTRIYWKCPKLNYLDK